ncbi:MAG: hypothetical protein K2K28_01940 [Clostridia bacterium]|nr:hypothetical protein [Clostridia bacterium]
MTFAAYIERQKGKIRDRHWEEILLTRGGEYSEPVESEQLFYDLSNLKGLNTYERINAGREV